MPVEAAGNGGFGLDQLAWLGDSGAIVVGAGGVDKLNWNEPGDLERMGCSSYGSRVNVQGWGEGVWSTGYGDKYGSSGSNDAYTNTFAGTSSASAMIAAVAADCVGYWKMGLMQPASGLKPGTLRSILINTGTPQVDTGIPPSPIGPRPDLKKAFTALEARVPAIVQWIDLSVPKSTIHAGDTFYLRAAITNNSGTSLGTIPLMAAFEIAGNFLFYPTFTSLPQVGLVNVGTGTTTVDIFPSLTWPTGLGTYYGAKAYALLFSPGLVPIGRLGYCEFGWAP